MPYSLRLCACLFLIAAFAALGIIGLSCSKKTAAPQAESAAATVDGLDKPLIYVDPVANDRLNTLLEINRHNQNEIDELLKRAANDEGKLKDDDDKLQKLLEENKKLQAEIDEIKAKQQARSQREKANKPKQQSQTNKLKSLTGKQQQLIVGPDLDKPLPDGWRRVRVEDLTHDDGLSDDAVAKKYSGHILLIGTVMQLGVDEYGKFIRYKSGNKLRDQLGIGMKFYYVLRGEMETDRFGNTESSTKEAESLKPGDRAGLHCAEGLERFHYDDDDAAEERKVRAELHRREQEQARKEAERQDPERRAAADLEYVRKLAERGEIEKAKERLRLILKETPNTKAAKEAKTFLYALNDLYK